MAWASCPSCRLKTEAVKWKPSSGKRDDKVITYRKNKDKWKRVIVRDVKGGKRK